MLRRQHEFRRKATRNRQKHSSSRVHFARKKCERLRCVLARPTTKHLKTNELKQGTDGRPRKRLSRRTPR